MNKVLSLLATAFMALTSLAGFYNDFALFTDLFIFPHQVAIADIICVGTVVTNRSGEIAEFSVDEFLWGSQPSSNILIKCANELDKLTFESNRAYLVFAFRNASPNLDPRVYRSPIRGFVLGGDLRIFL